MTVKPTVICLTPVRNEAWILDRFLTAASLWADHIIIADQMSTDGSREIAGSYEKVILIDNDSEVYHESERQKLLINDARKISGPRLIISLDADEIFTPNVLSSGEWEAVLNSEPGTIIKFQWANLLPGFERMWPGRHFPWGYMDDGYPYEGIQIHSERIPVPPGRPFLLLNEIKVMHLQYTQWARMESKHRWYQCFEKINSKDKSPLEIFRQYHHMYGIPKDKILAVPGEWIHDYQRMGLDITISNHESKNWWDEQIVGLIEEFGAQYFRKLSIWDINWSDRAKKMNKARPELFADPRSPIDRIIQTWLRVSQKFYQQWPYRCVDRFLQVVCGY